MREKGFLILINIMLWMVNTDCAYSFIRHDGPYKGKVIDADTREPIEGVVVLGVWNREIPGPGGAVSEFYDARETMTDKNGEFEIPGVGLVLWLWPFPGIEPMHVLIFKAGYEYFASPWESLKESKYLMEKKNIRWEGDKAIIPLKKLTMEERRKEGTSPPLPPGESSVEKVRLMLKEINKDAIERGADIIDTWTGGKVYEKNNIH